MRKFLIINLLVVLVACFQTSAIAQNHDHSSHDHSGHNHSSHEGHDHSGHNHSNHTGHNHGSESDHDHANHDGDHDHGEHHMVCGEEADHSFNIGATALHHISDANVFTIGPLHIPLPVILWSKDQGLNVFTTKKFHNHTLAHHADGHIAHKGYVLHGGTIKRIDPTYKAHGKTFDASKDVDITGYLFKPAAVYDDEGNDTGKTKEAAFACDGNNLWKLEDSSKADGGLFGGGLSSFIDFSLTKNVVSMLLICMLLFIVFRRVAKAYAKREGKEPKGLQSLMEVFVVFIRDEVAIPFLGEHKWEKYFGLLASIFFFIVGLNLFGQIPFFGNANVTGNLAVTAVIAIIAFFVTNISGNRHYWGHLFNPPGVPLFVKIILVPVELMGVFIKPITLMLRLFANIAAGHIVLVVFVGLIFVFGKEGTNMFGGYATGIGSVLLSLFMMAIELIVAFVQAFVFTLLTASYIGAATEEAHH
jgi:F-type H+-transporting ATPase subunit a